MAPRHVTRSNGRREEGGGRGGAWQRKVHSSTPGRLRGAEGEPEGPDATLPDHIKALLTAVKAV